MTRPSTKVTVIENMSNNFENILKEEMNNKVRNTISIFIAAFGK